MFTYPFDMVYEDLVEAAIDRNNVTFLDYLITKHENRKDIKINRDNCVSYSDSKGSLDCLKYHHEHGGSKIWDEWTCNDYLDCLQYVHENGGPGIWDEKTYKYEVKNGYLNCIKYIIEHDLNS